MSSTEVTPSPTEALDRQMVAHAQRRGMVRLTDGMIYTLLSWGKPHPGRKVASGNRIRLECPDGETRFTALKRDVIEIVEPS